MAEDASRRGVWSVWVDTGGTFTDCLAVDPGGATHRAKVLSSSALRARVRRVRGRRVDYEAPWKLVDGFADGARLHGLGPEPLPVAGSLGPKRRLELEAPAEGEPGTAFEIRFSEEAPVLAARWVTGTPSGQPLPPLVLRLATTRGTNALLERRGARTVLFVTRGFADLLRIGNQQRRDLFALDVRRPAPLYETVVEVAERLTADGEVLTELDLGGLAERVGELLDAGYRSAAVALLNSYRNPVHEEALAAFLVRKGFAYTAASAALAPLVKILPRAETAVVDAYLMPIVDAYLERVRSAVGESRVQVMTSAGGLVRAELYRAKDSLLSGPAGGVVGAAESGRACGFERLVAFDMGGTSTDVSRFDGDYEYLFEHRVGDATLAAPALAIETVAAGGGSICWLDASQLKVGPRSAGADPGPACYGVGGPLTLTDVNLLLGRLDPARIGIPIDEAAAERAAEELRRGLPSSAGRPREEVLEGFLLIANERMADAVRRISVRRGYDPRRYALVAFGGAGGQHACALAGLLGMTTVVLPRDAGLLSALGLGAAVVERFAQRQVLRPLAEAAATLDAELDDLAGQAVSEVAAEGIGEDGIEVRRRVAFLRFAGQETSVEVPVTDVAALAGAFGERYQALYGYRPAARPIEVESLRVVASSRRPAPRPRERAEPEGGGEAHPAPSDGTRRVYFGGGWHDVPVFDRDALRPGSELTGPALVFDAHSSLVLAPGWSARSVAGGSVVARRDAV